MTPYLPKRLSTPTKLQGVFPKKQPKTHRDPRSIPIAPWDQPDQRSTRPEALQISPRALVERDFAWNSFSGCDFFCKSLPPPKFNGEFTPENWWNWRQSFPIGSRNFVERRAAKFQEGQMFRWWRGLTLRYTLPKNEEKLTQKRDQWISNHWNFQQIC